jgi:hypothetical protein
MSGSADLNRIRVICCTNLRLAPVQGDTLGAIRCRDFSRRFRALRKVIEASNHRNITEAGRAQHLKVLRLKNGAHNPWFVCFSWPLA